MFIEIIFLGRGGQGVVTSSRVFAEVLFNSGYYVQTFPEFGPERSGAPVRAYVRVSDSPVELRIPIERGDAVVILDDRLLSIFTPRRLVKRYGLLLINSDKAYYDIGYGIKAVGVNADSIAELIGKPKAVGIAMVGALSRILGLVTIEKLSEIVKRILGPEDAEAALAAYRGVEEIAKTH